jgi:hypothetical protein
MLLPPTIATLILSEGATFILAFASVSRDSADPAANTDAVLRKFLREGAINKIVF